MATKFAAEHWKCPPEGTSAGTVAEWENHDNQLHDFLKRTIPEALQHTGATAFDEHLKGVQAVLRNWGAEPHVSDAGLFHSIYGTEGFQGFKLPFTRRAAIRNLIGPQAERLIWIFCLADRLSVDELVEKQHTSIFSKGQESNSDLSIQDLKIMSRIELGNFAVSFASETEWLEFIELTLADWLEQCEGAALKQNDLFQWKEGEAYSYRRVAYKQMAEILAHKVARLDKAKQMHDEVYAREGEETKGLHQRRTPAMTPAAKEAREALESIDQ